MSTHINCPIELLGADFAFRFDTMVNSLHVNAHFTISRETDQGKFVGGGLVEDHVSENCLCSGNWPCAKACIGSCSFWELGCWRARFCSFSFKGTATLWTALICRRISGARLNSLEQISHLDLTPLWTAFTWMRISPTWEKLWLHIEQ